MKNVGLDIGTNLLVAGMIEDENLIFKKERDAFYKIVPKTEVNKNSIKFALDKRGASYIMDCGDFVVVGEDALEIAIERNSVASRPMKCGVISPKEKNSLPILKLLIETLIGKGEEDSTCFFSVPAIPVDASFDILYHTEMMKLYIGQMGYNAYPINEAYCIGLSELIDQGLTGITISCLVPGTKIYTNNGIVNIENVKENDEVITHKGRFKRVNKVIKKEFKGVCTKVQLQGYADNTEQYKFVDNHELFVNRNNSWAWVGCDDLKIGDIVGEPIIKQDLSYSKPSICICECITSSKKYNKKSVPVGPNVQRLVGYFLGDGSVIQNTGIQFDFGKDEQDNIEDVVEILSRNFNKSSKVIDKGEGCKRVICHSVGMASWFRKNCYDDNKEKIYPWNINRINNSQCLNLLAGLIRSDGSVKDNYICFYNTSTNLVQLCKQLFSRLGVAASISYREPRTHLFEKENRLIVGKKQEWKVSTGKKSSLLSMSDMIMGMNCSNSRQNDRLFIHDGFCCSRVQDIEYEEYTGIVYDLQVEDDHSFSGPYLTIHNCGAGMVNCAVLHEGESLLDMSIARSGDFIDQSVANALDISPSLVQLEKEAGVDLYKPTTKIMEAVSVYYSSVIVYAIKNIIYELNKNKETLPIFKDPVPIIVGGGLSQAKGFVDKFNECLKMVEFPINVGEAKLAKDPYTCVANGCFLAAQM